MTRSDDLVSLLSNGNDDPAVAFRQGVVRSWNPATGANVIDVAGALLTDVPVLNTGEAITLKSGHIVGLLRAGTSYFIVGRITVPGNADFASASIAFEGVYEVVTNFVLTPTPTTRVTALIPVPAWADQALVSATASASVHNQNATTPGFDFAYVTPLINGDDNGSTSYSGLQTDEYATIVSTNQLLINNPGATITIGGQISSQVHPWTADPLNIFAINATAIFRSLA